MGALSIWFYADSKRYRKRYATFSNAWRVHLFKVRKVRNFLFSKPDLSNILCASDINKIRLKRAFMESLIFTVDIKFALMKKKMLKNHVQQVPKMTFAIFRESMLCFNEQCLLLIWYDWSLLNGLYMTCCSSFSCHWMSFSDVPALTSEAGGYRRSLGAC